MAPKTRNQNVLRMSEGSVGNTPAISRAREGATQPCLHEMYVAMYPDIFRLWRDVPSIVGIGTIHGVLMVAATRPTSGVLDSTREARNACGMLRMAYTVEKWKQVGEMYADPKTSEDDKNRLSIFPGCGRCGLPTGNFCDECDGGAVCIVCEDIYDTCGCDE